MNQVAMIQNAKEMWRSIQDELPQSFGPVSSTAIKKTRGVLERFPNSSSIKVLLADLLMFADDPTKVCREEAEHILRDVLNCDPFNSMAYSSLASLESLRDQDETAFELSRFVVELTCNFETTLSCLQFASELTDSDVLTEVVGLARESLKLQVERLRSVERTLSISISGDLLDNSGHS